MSGDAPREAGDFHLGWTGQTEVEGRAGAAAGEREPTMLVFKKTGRSTHMQAGNPADASWGTKQKGFYL